MSAPIFLKSKEEALPDIKNWLLSAFQEKKGCCVPKKDVFGAYADFCAEHHYESTTSASFGKFLKKIFPGVETRRLVRNDVQAIMLRLLPTLIASGRPKACLDVFNSNFSVDLPARAGADRQDPIPAAGLSWEGLYYLHSLLAAATQPLPPVLRPKRKTTRKAQKAAGDRPTIDHNLKRKRVEGHEARRVGGSNSESDSGDQDKQQPTVQDEPHDYADPPWTNDHNRRTTTRRTKSRLDYILN
ncbi:RFX DNAbinding domain containing protein [Acanthamoeba castellanii str. Neff]|uniref:RFX DNAbinding domain containing protein n=1 Tax=Acanthamoeba castellanii (strain ATCC 30010 / Neff) TaxID=1257118 RepID=L8HJC7_ACACF|nr:RFX DNAbinding domain containing protein [Acanthamoeba castellanii str. Neff]ELR25689.1 RFX DNAbinding domain containing protein [Acanthamoeba castellanii str. Neff]